MTSPALQRLLSSEEPAIRRLARRDLLHEPVEPTPADGPRVQKLLQGLDDDSVHPYKKWDGAHWRLVQLVELEFTEDERIPPAIDRVLDWATGIRSRTIDGLTRVHASMQGKRAPRRHEAQPNGRPTRRTDRQDLIEWQWPDGGRNCDPKAAGRRSSFHESLIPMHGLHEYGETETAARTAELLLDHRLFRRKDAGEPMHPE